MAYWKYTLIVVFLLFFSSLALAQPCGCVDCPQPILAPPNNTSTVCFEIVGATNTLLLSPGQGICGVELVFEHLRIKDLNMTLTSPGGQSVQLVGEANPFGPLCGGVAPQAANVNFVPASATAMPMAGTNATWDNDDFCSGSSFTGSYYPYDGDLEDFTTGDVNGTWCLEIETTPLTGLSGNFIDLNIILCDPTGLNCCFAEAGMLVESDTILCETDPYLDYSNLDPTYEFDAPDDTEYAYTYAISQDGIILDYTEDPDLVDFSPGNYSICGISYRLDEVAAFPQPNGVLTINELRDALNSDNPPLCAEVTNDCIEIEIVSPITPTELDENVCEGDTFYVGGLPFFMPGSYEINLQGYGCDSLVMLDLEVIDIPITTIDTTICISEVILVGDSTYFEDGMYETTMPSSENCDSIVILNLSVSDPGTTSISETLCEGQCYTVGDSCYTEEGLHVINFQTDADCDSIVTLFLIVQPIHAEIAFPDSLGCGDDMVLLDGRASDSNTNIEFQWFYQETAIPNTNENTLMVSDTGTYWLEVFHTTTQCRDTAEVVVYENTRLPIALIDTPDTLTCGTNSITLNAANSTGTGTLFYEWQTQTGNIDGATDQATANATIAATYTVMVTDDNNNCSATTSIEVVREEAFPTADAGPDGFLTCEISQDTLDGTGSSTEAFMEYLWVTDTGNIVQNANTLMPIVDADGAYTLIVTNTQNGCADSATVIVNQNMDLPNVFIALPDTLNCVETLVQIDASTSDNGPLFTFEWTTISGHIVPPTETTLQATVDEPGIYELTITNTATNCSQTNVVTVEQETIPPTAIATVNGVLTCNETGVMLDANNSSGNNNLSYEWQDINEATIGTDVTVMVGTADTFYLMVTDVVTQCVGRDTIVVTADTLSPIADAGLGFEIDCITTEGRLNGNDSTLGLDYLWTGTGIVADETTLTPLVNQAGWFYLTITNPSNACTAIDSVEVTQDNNVPVVDAGESGTLNCIDTCISLLASIMPVNNNFTIEWMVSDGGNIKEGAEGLSPIVNAGGTYTLIVRDTSNNCMAMDVVIIDENIVNPIANAGQDGLLNCNNEVYTIGDLSSSSGGNISYLWTSPDGFIEPSDINILQPDIDSVGTYVLQVMDNVSGCQSNDTVVVTSDFVEANIVIAPPENLTCSVPCVDLDASATSGNSPLSFQWSSDNGEVKEGENTAIATASEAGIYILMVTNMDNGCIDTSMVNVTQDADVPIAFTQDTIPIACGSGIARLEGMGSSTGDAYTYQWLGITPDANVMSGANNIAAEANAIGSYMLIVTDTIRQCADSSIVTVVADCTPMPTLTADGDTLNCFSMQIMLHGTLSSGTNLTYEWYWIENDTIINTTDLDVPISNGGTYVFTVTNNDFNTIGSDTITIIENRVFPIVDAGQDTILSCNVPCAVLGGNNTSQGSQFTYEWGTDTGNILDEDTLSMVKVNDGGIYDLTVTNLENGCTTTDFVNVTLDQTFLDICFIPPFEISCIANDLLIDATCSTTGPTIEHQWTTNDGTIISSTQNLTLRVSTPGTYYLSSTDTSNGCIAMDSILITAQECNLNISTSGNDTLTCVVEEVLISATVEPEEDDYQMSWTDSNGNEISDSLSAIVNAEGLYTFNVNNLTTGEMASQTLAIIRNETPPIADAGMAMTLDCDTDIVTLDGSMSEQNATIEWTSLGGHPINSPNAFQATVIDTGIYQITVISLENGCIATDQVVIDENFDTPIADAGTDQEISCSASNTVLSGENSTINQTSLSWVALSGNPNDVCAGGNTTNPIVCSAGVYILTVTSDINGCFDTDTVSVSLNQAAPPINAGEDLVLDCENTSVELDGSGPPLGEFMVEWTNLSSNQTFGMNDYTPEVNEAAIYEMRVINTVTGCDSTDIVEVSIDTVHAMVDAGLPDTITCMDLSVDLIGTVSPPFGNYDYAWTSTNNNLIENPTSLEPSVSAADIYTLIVTNLENNCQDSAQVTIFQDENLPDVFAGNDSLLTCGITEMRLMGEVPNAANLELTWTNSSGVVLSNDLSLNISSPDTFILTAFNPINNCSFSDALIVSEDTTPPTAVISTPNALLTCDRQSLDLNAMASSPMGNLAYEWTRNNNPTILSDSSTLTISNSDTYHLMVTNLDNACRHDTSIIINQDESLPIVNIFAANDLTCLEDTVLLDGSASIADNPIYIWTNENGDTIGNELLLTVIEEGNYTLTIINSDNGCKNNEVAFVENKEILPTAIASVTNDAVLDCVNTSVQVSAEGSSTDGDFSYHWTSSNTNVASSFNFMTNTVGTYVLEVMNNETGCTAFDSINVIADAVLITGLELTVQEQDCFGEGDATLFIDQIIGGNAPFYYNLNQESFKAFPQFDYLSPGEYLLQVEDAFGCTWDTLVTISQPEELLVDLIADEEVIQLGDATQLNAAINGNYTSIKWTNLDSLGCPDCLNQTVAPLEMTHYAVRVENENGCTAEDNITIFVAKDRRVYLPNAFSPSANDLNQQYIVFAGNDVEEILDFKIFDRWGNLVFGDTNFPPNDPKHAWDGTLDGEPLNPAVFGYIVEVLYKDGYREMLKGEIVLIR